MVSIQISVPLSHREGKRLLITGHWLWPPPAKGCVCTYMGVTVSKGQRIEMDIWRESNGSVASLK